MDEQQETRIRETGRELYELAEGEKPSLFETSFWTGKLMEWAMRDEAFKVELFRFIDVFPVLKTPQALADHLDEYLRRPGLPIPAALRWGLNLISPVSRVCGLVSRVITANIEKMAGNFIAGPAPGEALPVWARLRARGLAFSADLLGEAVVSEKEARSYIGRCLELLDTAALAARDWETLGGQGGELDWGYAPKVNISVKISSAYSQMNLRAMDYTVSQVKERLRPLMRKVMDTGAHIFFDMEQHDLKNITLAVYRSLLEEGEFRDYPHTGVVIQAYLRESARDLRELLAWGRSRGRRFWVRLVKGAYWDGEVLRAGLRNWPVPVFTAKHETDANFEKLAAYLLENHAWVRTACATHNIRSIAFVMETAKRLKVPFEDLEFQVLYGMAEPIRNAMLKMGVPVRVYTPVGEMIPGMAYLVRRLLENSANESFVRLSFVEGAPLEDLLKNPLELEDRSGDGTRFAVAGPAAEKGFRNEPHADWAVSDIREAFGRTLKDLRRTFPLKVPLIVGGREVRTPDVFRSTNPNDPEEVVGEISSGGRDHLEEAVGAAESALGPWRDLDPRDRAGYLFKVAAMARQRRYELAALQVLESGKDWGEADADVCEAVDFLEYYGREMIRLSVPQKIHSPAGETSVLFYEPRGVAAVIAPWNFPMAISTGMISAALVTGNTVVYKPSSLSPVMGGMICRLFEECGLPPGVLNLLPGPGSEIGDLLVAHPLVALVAFTGSRGIGHRILELAGRSSAGSRDLKKVVVELGGKNAIIVDDDADLDEAVVHILDSAFGYQGQKCSSCSRLIVHRDCHDKLMSRLIPAAKDIETGPVEDPKNLFGAVIDEKAEQKILDYIRIGKEEGVCLLERKAPNGRGHMVPMAIFTDIRPEHRLAQDEIFGPVLSVMLARDFDEALEIACGTGYALTGGVFSRSPLNIEKAKTRFRVGNLYINRGITGALVGRHPFGGFKHSGLGSKAGGPDYLLQFTVSRNVVENTVRRGFAPLRDRDM